MKRGENEEKEIFNFSCPQSFIYSTLFIKFYALSNSIFFFFLNILNTFQSTRFVKIN